MHVRSTTVHHEASAEEDAFLTVKEFCTRLRISRGTARRIIRDGLVEAVKTTNTQQGRVRIPVASYEAYLQEQTVQAKATG